MLCIPFLFAHGCRSKPIQSATPTTLPTLPSAFVDRCPKWSPDGRNIAFLRETTDRKYQLCIADASLRDIQRKMEPEFINPDKPLQTNKTHYTTPDGIAWSADSRHIVIPRLDWVEMERSAPIPGVGLWIFDLKTEKLAPVALHYPSSDVGKLEKLFYYRSPTLSPDGKYLGFIVEGVYGARQIAVSAFNAVTPQEVSPRFDNYQDSDWLTWSTHGKTASSILIFRQTILRTERQARTETLRCLQPGSSDGSLTGEVWRMSPTQASKPTGFGSKDSAGVGVRVAHLAVSGRTNRVAFSLTDAPLSPKRWQVWVLDSPKGIARRVSPLDGKGYCSPTWIDETSLAFLSPTKQGFEVFVLNTNNKALRKIGRLPTADFDWSPSKEWIVYAATNAIQSRTDRKTTLKLMPTGISIRTTAKRTTK